ncbi:hypothetical protein AB834_02215 [PVC group bacterium (ex Bugula neritina AB1)]|nr:hypothetical protein AB834_02215 [PVC group bacterium (ex Bugula neritina AB1)]
MIGVGEKLRDCRQKKEISLEVISDKTNLKKDFILALEEENFSELPTMIHAKGFLKTYSRFLDLDIDDFLISFDELVKENSKEEIKNIQKSSQVNNKPKWQDIKEDLWDYLFRSKKKVKFIVVGITLFLISYYTFLWVYKNIKPIFVKSYETVSGWTKSSPKKSPDNVNVEKKEIISENSSVISFEEGLFFRVDVKSSVWVSVRVDGDVLYEGIMAKGMNESWEAEDEILVNVSDLRAINCLLNGKAIEELKNMNKKVSKLKITKNGIEFR